MCYEMPFTCLQAGPALGQFTKWIACTQGHYERLESLQLLLLEMSRLKRLCIHAGDWDSRLAWIGNLLLISSSSINANESAGKKQGNSLPTSVSSRIDAQAAVLHESFGKDKKFMFMQFFLRIATKEISVTEIEPVGCTKANCAKVIPYLDANYTSPEAFLCRYTMLIYYSTFFFVIYCL